MLWIRIKGIIREARQKIYKLFVPEKQRFLKDNRTKFQEVSIDILDRFEEELNRLRANENIADELKVVPGNLIYTQIKPIYLHKVKELCGMKYDLSESDKEELAESLARSMEVIIKSEVQQSVGWSIR